MHEIVFANTHKREQYLAKKNPFANFFAVKNSQFEIISCCAGISSAAGFKNPIDVIGKTDYDMLCPAQQLYEVWKNEDQSVIRSQAKKHFICVAMWHGSDIKVLSNTKEYAAGDIIINHTELSNGPLYQYCQNSIQKIPSDQRQQIHLTYEIIQHYDALTCRESDIVFLLSHQLKAKQIAALLHRSPRTIQHTIDRIRCKLSCEKSSDIIQLAHFLGWKMKVPVSLCNQTIFKSLIAL